MLTWILGFSFILAVQAETASPSITDATPAIIESTPTLVADASPSPKTTENAEAAPGTHYDKGSVDKFEGTPDGDTGNSAGEIIFMLVIFLFCLFLSGRTPCRFARYAPRASWMQASPNGSSSAASRQKA